MKFAPASCHFLSLRSKYSPQHHLIHPYAHAKQQLKL
jgi:hypothetical protein